MPDSLTWGAICRHARLSLGKPCHSLSPQDVFRATSLAVRDRLMQSHLETEARYEQAQAKRLYYLSLEFLVGRSLGNNLLNLEGLDACRDALLAQGIDLDEVRAEESDAALGNGGLGRLAACFLDSLATLDLPGYGYGINYEFGLFRQEIENGYQREKPDSWRTEGTPWLIERPDEACVIPVYGRVDSRQDNQGRYSTNWTGWDTLTGIPYDMPIVGYGGHTVNVLRLFSARASVEFDMQIFNDGDYVRAVQKKMSAETVSKILYPSDAILAGRELRLLQEYFLVACSLRDLLRKYQATHNSFDAFPSQVAIQMNDTHPALAVAELMRLLLDENDLGWDAAWEITQATCGYTNHTLMSEALERWPVSLMEYVLPRHLQIIYEINRRLMEQVGARWPGDGDRMSRMSLIEEGAQKQVRMANLAIVGSHSINGVSALHSDLVKTDLVPDFYQLWPERFSNKTNGITQRRWLLKANLPLADLISDKLGDGWISDLEQLCGLEPFADVSDFQQAFRQVKRGNKERLAQFIQETCGVSVNPASLFDVQVKRMHLYKRQLLNVMHILHDYLRLTEDGMAPTAPRTYIFAGKAAPGFWAAKQVIKLIHSVGQVINHDPRAHDWIKVVFAPDYRVSLAERIIPAADLSEQISTAGLEASGTGNMKLALNGALTMGTLDGANIEIQEEVGPDNIYIFGLTAEEVNRMRREGRYHPADLYHRNPDLKRIVDCFVSGFFSGADAGIFRWIYEDLLYQGDTYFHLADLPSYIEAQDRAGQEYCQPALWTRKAILNVARIGKFSSDRTIREYARDIWNLKPVP